MRVAKKFTPEVLIEAPRRGPAVPSPDGTKAFYTLSTHTVGGDTLKEVKILDVETGASQVLSDSSRVHDVAWLTADSVAYLESGDDGTTELKVADVEWSRMTSSPGLASRSVAKFAGPVKCLRLRALGDGSFALAVVGRVGSDGKLFNETREDGKSSIRVYDDSNVRFVSLNVSSLLLHAPKRSLLCFALVKRVPAFLKLWRPNLFLFCVLFLTISGSGIHI